MSAAEPRPLWAMCTMNDEAMSESTPGDTSFEYVDISNVSEGHISENVETYEFKSAPSRARRVVRGGDVVISTVRTYLRAIAQVPEYMSRRIFSTGFAVLHPLEQTDPRYLAYVIGTRQVIDEIIATSVGVSYPAIQGTTLHRIRVPYHQHEIQISIADCLDRETGEINAMITKLDDLFASLRLRRAAVSSSLQNMDFTPVRLQWLATEIDERIGTPSSHLPLLSVSIHHGVQLRSESTSGQQASSDLSKYKVARVGDIVLNRMRAFQGGLGQTKVDGLVSPDYAVLRPNENLMSDWAELAMRSPQFIELMSQRLRGIGSADQSNVRTPRINVRDLFDLVIPLPPLDEQARIAARLDAATSRIDAMLEKVAELKSLLIERRAALITDVITGKKAIA